MESLLTIETYLFPVADRTVPPSCVFLPSCCIHLSSLWIKDTSKALDNSKLLWDTEKQVMTQPSAIETTQYPRYRASRRAGNPTGTAIMKLQKAGAAVLAYKTDRLWRNPEVSVPLSFFISQYKLYIICLHKVSEILGFCFLTYANTGLTSQKPATGVARRTIDTLHCSTGNLKPKKLGTACA